MDSATTETLTPCQATAAKLVEDLGAMLKAIRDIASCLEFIEGGLGIENPNPRGAALALEDTELATLDLVDTVERMTQSARELAGMPTEADDQGVRQDQCTMASEVRS